MASVKIFVSYKNNHYPLRSAVLTPIQTGCDLTKERFPDMLRDNDGTDNISAANLKYNELTAQYWVWKNYEKIGNPDYVGFMHYRRHFLFDGWRGDPDQVWPPPKGPLYMVPFISDDYLKHIADDHIKRQIADCDVIVMPPYDVKNCDHPDLFSEYNMLVGKKEDKSFAVFLDTVKRLCPEYAPEVSRMEKDSQKYLCNMFVMTKELFFKYSEFLFSVLAEIDKKVDSSAWDPNGQAIRFLGFLGECCLSLFIFHLQNQETYRIKEIPGSYILSDTGNAGFLWLQYCYFRVMCLITCGKNKKKYKDKKYAVKKTLSLLKTLKANTE